MGFPLVIYCKAWEGKSPEIMKQLYFKIKITKNAVQFSSKFKSPPKQQILVKVDYVRRRVAQCVLVGHMLDDAVRVQVGASGGGGFLVLRG